MRKLFCIMFGLFLFGGCVEPQKSVFQYKTYNADGKITGEGSAELVGKDVQAASAAMNYPSGLPFVAGGGIATQGAPYLQAQQNVLTVQSNNATQFGIAVVNTVGAVVGRLPIFSAAGGQLATTTDALAALTGGGTATATLRPAQQAALAKIAACPFHDAAWKANMSQWVQLAPAALDPLIQDTVNALTLPAATTQP